MASVDFIVKGWGLLFLVVGLGMVLVDVLMSTVLGWSWVVSRLGRWLLVCSSFSRTTRRRALYVFRVGTSRCKYRLAGRDPCPRQDGFDSFLPPRARIFWRVLPPTSPLLPPMLLLSLCAVCRD